MQETQIWSVGCKDPLGEEMATCFSQDSCLGNPMDRGAWQATVHGVPRVGHDLVTKPLPPPFWVPTQLNENKVIWGMMETMPYVRYQPQWRRCYNASGRQLGQMFILFDFDPVIQFGWIYNKTNSKTNQVFKSEWFGLKISVHHLLAGGSLNTFMSYFFVFQFLICRLWMNFTGLMRRLNQLIHWKYCECLPSKC